LLQTIEINDNKTKSNAEIIDETYYDYHGKYEDGDTPVLQYEELKGVVIA